MSLFTTPVEVTPFPWRSDHARHHVLIGSCFTEHVGTLMTELKFPVTVNPSGILYNPVSVASCLRRLVSGQPFTRDELFEHDGLWHSYSHHGRFSAPDAGEALENINRALTLGAVSLRNAGFLLITLGTARVYEHRATGETVANCHKVPAREFRPYRLTVAHAVASLREALEACWQANPSLKVILTVSPVRHNQDGPTENQLSKAVLLLAADALVSGYAQVCDNALVGDNAMVDGNAWVGGNAWVSDNARVGGYAMVGGYAAAVLMNSHGAGQSFSR